MKGQFIQGKWYQSDYYKWRIRPTRSFDQIGPCEVCHKEGNGTAFILNLQRSYQPGAFCAHSLTFGHLDCLKQKGDSFVDSAR